MNEQENPIEGLSKLKKEFQPPSELEARVVSSLIHRGLLRRRFNWIRAVAAILIFVFGVGCGRWIWKSTPVQYTHILILREDAARFQRNSHEASLVREYSDWARTIRSDGTLITGEKLDTTRVFLPEPIAHSESGGEVAGLFLLKATTDQVALKVSQSCPHLKHGGSVELRRIDLDAH